MKIKIIALLIAVVSLFPFVGTASAASCFSTGVSGAPAVPQGDLNIYGASAQFTFWKNEFVNYLTAAGCTWANGTSWAQSQATDSATNPSHYVIQANCSAVGGPAVVNFRVSSKASYDGPAAVDAQVTPYSVNNCGVGANANQRELLHGGTVACPWGSTSCPAPAAANGDCEVVTWGSADVAVGDFQQITTGASGRNFKLNPLVMSANTVDFCHPNAIGFGFWVNNSVTTTAGPIISNIQALEARMIYSGKLTNWSQLASTSMNAAPIVVCSRTAGSGTAASLDFQIVRPSSIITTPLGNDKFNDSTGNEVTCVSSNAGAIGVFDADRSVAGLNISGPLSVNGIAPSTAALEGATYLYTDGAQHAYVSLANSAVPWINDVCLWAGWPARLPSATWASTCNMNYLPGGNGAGSLAAWAPSTVKGTLGCTCP
ncbi:MAG TPA: substrate-binding domain-containing protein [Nitrospirota bacterium]|nr:substrate-binding domain-containing protein [Nitrospirota bacterium]